MTSYMPMVHVGDKTAGRIWPSKSCMFKIKTQTNKQVKQTNNHVQKNITEAIPPFAPLQGKVKEQAVAVDVTVTFTLFTYR